LLLGKPARRSLVREVQRSGHRSTSKRVVK
jgi:hypothetical protein